jgi:hypothetical protein
VIGENHPVETSQSKLAISLSFVSYALHPEGLSLSATAHYIVSSALHLAIILNGRGSAPRSSSNCLISPRVFLCSCAANMAAHSRDIHLLGYSRCSCCHRFSLNAVGRCQYRPSGATSHGSARRAWTVQEVEAMHSRIVNTDRNRFDGGHIDYEQRTTTMTYYGDGAEGFIATSGIISSTHTHTETILMDREHSAAAFCQST